jgi:hypothetical protein
VAHFDVTLVFSFYYAFDHRDWNALKGEASPIEARELPSTSCSFARIEGKNESGAKHLRT